MKEKKASVSKVFQALREEILEQHLSKDLTLDIGILMGMMMQLVYQARSDYAEIKPITKHLAREWQQAWKETTGKLITILEESGLNRDMTSVMFRDIEELLPPILRQNEQTLER